FTSGKSALESTIRRGGIRTVLSARLVQKKLDNFPWAAVERTWNLEEILLPLKPKIALWRAAVAILPWQVLAGVLAIPRRGGADEAVLLFTSGSSGEPKGVVLSHRNVLANVSQFRLMVNFQPGQETVLASLPFFHSFGCTVTLWFPLIEGVRTVTYPNPLDTGKNAELIAKYGCTLLLATPTFLRGYLRKATREQLQSLTRVVVGAEKLPTSTAAAFEEKFGHPVLEGYGLTETAPVVAVNLHDVPVGHARSRYFQPARRLGSVGKMAPGLAAKITDPDTDAPRSLHETGMLWLRGANIFEGYFNDPEQTNKVKTADGWFRTGDLGRVDEDGFLHIEGRVSRFSKIAGEMVPHETVETRVAEALDLPNDGERRLVVVGIPDLAKGEALVLLATIDIDATRLRAGLAALGVPNLWIPKTIRRIEHLPVLGTGKLDLKGCRDLALAEESAA
ncbi:MAG: AMP-binding protein, partial [Verrucomicrobia bacterium]|nr:AMP-binding protein [Verrucomicrobiota bacterium]